MKTSDKYKLKGILNKIENDAFDESHIESLFMILRECNVPLLFREIGDFVAHRDKKTKGLAQNAIESVALRMNFGMEFQMGGKQIDFTKPLPSYCKNLFIYQLQSFHKKKLIQLGYSKKEFLRELDDFFEVDKKKNLMILKTFNPKFINTLQAIIAHLNVHPIAMQHDIESSIIVALKQNQIPFDFLKIKAQMDKILICILLILDKTTFQITGSKDGYCTLSNSVGKLSLCGITLVSKFLERILFDLIITDLDVSEWVEEETLLNNDVILNKNFKISNL